MITKDPEYGTIINIQGEEGEEDGDTLGGGDYSHDSRVFTSQIKGALESNGLGLRAGGKVTAGSGLSVNIGALIGTVLSPTDGPVAIRTKITENRAALPASSTFYLFAAIQATGDMDTDTLTSRLPAFLTDSISTMDGAQLLAQVATSASAVTNVVDMRTLIDGGHLYFVEGALPWDDGTDYRTGAVVENDGLIYFALRPSTNVEPGTDATKWRLFAESAFTAIASQAEAEAGTENTKGMTSLRTAQAIAAQRLSEVFSVAASDETTAITTGAAKITFRIPYDVTLIGLRAALTTASTGAAIQVDVNRAGSSILTTPLTIDTGEKTSTTAAVPVVIDSGEVDMDDDDEFTIDVDAVGTGAKGLKIAFYWSRR